MYQYVPRRQIIEVLRHLRDLLRQEAPTTERGRLVAERREIVAKYIISNLPRTGPHPTLKTVMEVVETFLLTVGAAHKLFGYDLGALREHDLLLNSGRTHIIESYSFDRDKLIDIPLELAEASAFQSDAMISDLVRRWQTAVPIRVLEGRSSAPGAFYVHVGTEDSRGSSLPPGSMALVEPVHELEASRPNPRLIYLLQFGDGYKCSRCVVTRRKLQLLTSARAYMRAREFACPGEVRVVGRIRMFAHALPQPEYELHDVFQSGRRPAKLILPWEQHTRSGLFSTEYRRFRRPERQDTALRDTLRNLLQSPLSKRTERRYRHQASSEPHISTLIQLTLLYLVRYSDSLGTGGYSIDDRGRFSLREMTNARSVMDLPRRPDALPRLYLGAPWNDRRSEFIDWLPLLCFKFPDLNIKEDSIVRVARRVELPGLEPSIAAGSWMRLRPPGEPLGAIQARGKGGWTRPIYVLRRGLDFLMGYLEPDSGNYALLSNTEVGPRRELLRFDELSSLRSVAGIAVPVESETISNRASHCMRRLHATSDCLHRPQHTKILEEIEIDSGNDF